MLLNIHVKNFALINEIDINLNNGLNVLTGETGAGKSILIDSVNAALGARFKSSMIRNGADYALIELTFKITNSSIKKVLEDLDIFLEEDCLIISRRLLESRSVSKINGETVPLHILRQVTSLLIDIHGQHEHQSLLNKSKHLDILDEYCKASTNPVKTRLKKVFSHYQKLHEQLSDFSMDEEVRLRELDFCRYEIEEIENTKLKPGEEKELSDQYRRMLNSKKIAEGIAAVDNIINQESYDSVAYKIGQASKEFYSIVDYDNELYDLSAQLSNIEDLINVLSRDLKYYIETLVFEEEEFNEVEKRLDKIHELQLKYGRSYDEIMQSLEEKKQRYENLVNYEINRERILKELKLCQNELKTLSEELSTIRRTESFELVESIQAALIDLNFLDVQFSMEFTKKESFTSNGYDEACFLISTNPGENQKPLNEVASGGELSRIMLAIKAVLADSDEIPTLIFDEIDTGISGRTAQKVSEKLRYISKTHQIICITHLPQIAAAADTHFLIEKNSFENKTITTIDILDNEGMIKELARLLGGAEITDTVLEHAREMKTMAVKAGLY